MSTSRARRNRKPYQPWPRRAPASTARTPRPAGGKSAQASPDDQAGARAQPARVSDNVARFQRRIIGSDAWLRVIEDHVAQLVNAERRRNRLPPVRTDERLRRSARAHSADMANRGYFAHQAPDGTAPADRIRASGHLRPAAENIAQGHPDPPSVMRAWMNSPRHRRNILHPHVRSIGVGLHRGPGGPWWTQHYGYE